MLKRLVQGRRGSVTLIVTVMSLSIIGMAALSVDMGQAYSARAKNQQIADAAAYAGALAYSGNNNSTTAMNNAVSRIATLNGLASNAITASIVSSPSGDGNNAVQAQVTTTDTVIFAGVLGDSSPVSVTASSYAEIKAGTPGCIVALQTSGTGISASGGTSITATSCAVASNGTVSGQNTSVYLQGGATITTPIVDYASNNAPVVTGGAKIQPPSGTASVTYTHATSTDKLATNSIVTSATARISTASAVTSPSAPSITGGTAASFGYGSAPTLPSGCTGTLSSNTWTVKCVGTGPFTFGTISLHGGITLVLDTSGVTSNPTFNINGDIDGTSGTAMTFGAGNYIISGGILTSGSMVIKFKSGGIFKLGTTVTSCGGGSGYSLCVNGGQLLMPDPSSGNTTASTFSFAGGIYQNGSGMPPNPPLSLGYGSTANSYAIGKSSAGYSINVSNGALIMADSSNSSKTLQMAGGIVTTGGTCLQVAAANNHDINGSINAAGGIYLGAGTYTVNGYAAFGANNGGNVSNCPTSGATTGVSALGVSLILSGTSTISCNGNASAAFCLGAGYSNVVLTAPTSSATVGSSTAGLAVVGPTSSSLTGAADFTTGATNTQISGVFYFPYGPMLMSGGAQLHDTVDSTACLELVAAQITMTGGGAAGSTCTGSGGASLAGSSASGGSTQAIAIVQ